MLKSCTKCGKLKPLELFYRQSKSSDGYRPDCKDCSNKQKRDRNEQKPYEATLIAMSNGILKRVKHAVHKPRNKSYKDKGIQCLIGETAGEIRDYLHRNFETQITEFLDKDITPSVDRIDSTKHYEEGNIQIIPLEDNVKKGTIAGGKATAKTVIVTFPDSKTMEFESVSACSRELKLDRKNIQTHIKNGTTTRYGLSFRCGIR